MNKKKMIPYFYLLPITLIFCILMVYPICQVIGFSVKDNVIVNPNPQFAGMERVRTLILEGARKFPEILGCVAVFSYYTGDGICVDVEF